MDQDAVEINFAFFLFCGGGKKSQLSFNYLVSLLNLNTFPLWLTFDTDSFPLQPITPFLTHSPPWHNAMAYPLHLLKGSQLVLWFLCLSALVHTSSVALKPQQIRPNPILWFTEDAIEKDTQCGIFGLLRALSVEQLFPRVPVKFRLLSPQRFQ